MKSSSIAVLLQPPMPSTEYNRAGSSTALGIGKNQVIQIFQVGDTSALLAWWKI
jgi:hypothetical protein